MYHSNDIPSPDYLPFARLPDQVFKSIEAAKLHDDACEKEAEKLAAERWEKYGKKVEEAGYVIIEVYADDESYFNVEIWEKGKTFRTYIADTYEEAYEWVMNNPKEYWE